MQRAKRDNLAIEVIPSDSTGALDLAALEASIDSDVGLIAMTWIPTNGGLVNPAAEVGEIARRHGAPWVARDRYTLREDARRFETWENSYALRAGLGAAFNYAEEIGIGAIERQVRHLADHCRALLAAHPRIQVRDLGQERCGILSFSVEGGDPRPIVDRMAEAGFAIGASDPASTRLDAERRNLPTLLRIAPHYYNTDDEIERAVAALTMLL